MMRNSIATLVAFLVLCWSLAGRAAERPNIVLILADDLGYETVGCYGGTSYKTPNLDRLAAEGIQFDRAYAMPLCTNTRVQLMTGKYNFRNWKAFGILDPREKTFGHLMQQVGYKTCIAGKWQMTSYDPPDYPGAETRRNTGMHPRDAGFDRYSLWHVGHTETKGSRYADPVIEQDGKLLTDTAGKYGPDLWTDFIGDFMEQHTDKPFFVYYSMALPHNPMNPTPDSPEWSDLSRRHSDETPFAADMIEYTDKMVGKVVAKLDQLKLRDKTLILFYSDNGTNTRVMSQFGNRLVRGEKGKGTELGIRVPAVANWQGRIPAGIISEDLIDSVDILPTILDVAGAGEVLTAERFDGKSFSTVLTQQSPGPREWVYVHQDPRPGWDKDRFELIRLALDKQYKLYEDGRMFDLSNDPFEERPLRVADDSATLRAGRLKLQSVLDSLKPYPMFDPSTVPRPNPSDSFQGYQFHDQGGLIVIEAEQLPIPRDESWRAESHSRNYLGSGYLRSLRQQPGAPDRGQTLVATNLNQAGLWKVALRCRSDHASGQENQLWLRVADGPWMIGQIPDGNPGQWQWVSSFVAPEANSAILTELQLGEGENQLWLAPCASNFKIDRIVLYQSDQEIRALDVNTPVSEYHPWASP